MAMRNVPDRLASQHTQVFLSCSICCLQDAKRAVAVALRNRWRRHELPADLAEEVHTTKLGHLGCRLQLQICYHA